MTCTNCSREAVWVFKTPGISERPYCEAHLPTPYRGTTNVVPASDTDSASEAEEEAPEAAEAPQEPVEEKAEEKPAPRPRKRQSAKK